MAYSALKLTGAASDGKSVKKTYTQQNHGFTAGDVIRWNTGSDGNTAEYVKAQANSAYNSEVIGIVESINGGDFVLVSAGEITLTNIKYPMGSSEDVFFLSAATAGMPVASPPSSSGEIIKPILTRIAGGLGIVTNYIGTAIGGNSTVSLSSLQPVGQITPWAGTGVLPSGWKSCDGASLGISDYDEYYKSVQLSGIALDGFGNPDPRGQGNADGSCCRYGFIQEIQLDVLPAINPVVGNTIWQGNHSGNNYYTTNFHHPNSGGDETVVGKILSWDTNTKTITVEVDAVKYNHADANLPGTDADVRWDTHNAMFGSWAIDGDNNNTSTVSWNTTPLDSDPAQFFDSGTIVSSKITHVKVPDMRGRNLIGTGVIGEGGSAIQDYLLGSYGGKEEHILTKDEMPLHGHSYSENGQEGLHYWVDIGTNQGEGFGSGNQSFVHRDQVAADGKSLPHSRMSPWFGVEWIIRVSSTAQAALLNDVTIDISMDGIKDTKLSYGAGFSFGNILRYEHDVAGSTYGWYNRMPLIRDIASNSGADLVFHTSQAVDGGITPDGEARWAIDQTYGSLKNFNRYTHGGSADTWGLTGTTDPPKIQISTRANGGGPSIYSSEHGAFVSENSTAIIFNAAASDTSTNAFYIKSQGLYRGSDWPASSNNRAHGRSAAAHMWIESGNVTGGGSDAGYIGFNLSDSPDRPFHFNVPWNEDAVLRIEATGDGSGGFNEQRIDFRAWNSGAELATNYGGSIYVPHRPGGVADVQNSGLHFSSARSGDRREGTVMSFGGRNRSQIFIGGVTACGAGAGAYTAMTATLNVVSTTDQGEVIGKIASFRRGDGNWGQSSRNGYFESTSPEVAIWSNLGNGSEGTPGAIGTVQSNAFGLVSGGTTRLRVHSDGNIGIGYNWGNQAPPRTLTVRSLNTDDSKPIAVFMPYSADVAGTDTGVARVCIWAGDDTGSYAGIGTTGGHAFRIKTNSTQKLTVRSGGQVAIGLSDSNISSVATKLAVGPNSHTDVSIKHNGSATGVGVGGANFALDEGSKYVAGFQNHNSGGGGIISMADQRAIAAINDNTLNVAAITHSPLFVGRTGGSNGNYHKAYMHVANRFANGGQSGSFFGQDGPATSIWNWGLGSGRDTSGTTHIAGGSACYKTWWGYTAGGAGDGSSGISASGINLLVSRHEGSGSLRKVWINENGMAVGAVNHNDFKSYRSTAALEVYSHSSYTKPSGGGSGAMGTQGPWRAYPGISCDGFINGLYIGHGASAADAIATDVTTNTAVGRYALDASGFSGGHNTAVGYLTLSSCTTGDHNTAYGSSSLTALTNGYHNIAVGGWSGYKITSGHRNVMIGLHSQQYVTTASMNTSVGMNSLRYTSSGTGNCAIGYKALAGVTANGGHTGTYGDQTAIGANALEHNKGELDGGWNVAVGAWALNKNNGRANVAVGTSALRHGVGIGAATAGHTGSWNVAVGINAGGNFAGVETVAIGHGSMHCALGATGSRNTAVGYSTLYALSTGSRNTAIGHDAGKAITKGCQNVGVGSDTLKSTTTGHGNVGVGYKALNLNTEAGYNTAVGWHASERNISGDSNVAIGYRAREDCTSGNDNVAIGAISMYYGSGGDSNVAIGRNTLSHGDYTASGNVAIGINSGAYMTTGVRNVSVGPHSLASCRTAHSCTAIGYKALNTVDLGSSGGQWNTAIGASAGDAINSGRSNTIVGAFCGTGIVVGEDNVCMGVNSMRHSGATASNNVCVGTYSGEYLGSSGDVFSDEGGASSDYNVLIGHRAGQYANAITKCVAIGANALRGLSPTAGITGSCNIAIGYNAMQKWVSSHPTAGHNTCIGDQACQSLPDGTNNTIMGANAMVSANATLNSWTAIGAGVGSHLTTTSGVYNTLIGPSCVNNEVTTSFTGNYNTFIGDTCAKNQSGDISCQNTVLLGHEAGKEGTWLIASNNIVLGNDNITTLRCKVAVISALSDARDKTDIEDVSVGLDFVNALKPRFFTWNERNVEEGSPYIDKKDMGFIAQELDEVETQFGVAEQTDLVDKTNPEKLETRNARLIPVLVKAIQELSAKVEELEGRINNE